MDFAASEKAVALRTLVEDFFNDHILTHADDWHREINVNGGHQASFMATLKAAAFERGLWNMALPALAMTSRAFA